MFDSVAFPLLLVATQVALHKGMSSHTERGKYQIPEGKYAGSAYVARLDMSVLKGPISWEPKPSLPTTQNSPTI